jgi:hypothetical protein
MIRPMVESGKPTWVCNSEGSSTIGVKFSIP